MYQFQFISILIYIVGCLAQQHELKRRFGGNSSFCQAHAFKVLTPISTYCQFIICMYYLSKSHTKQDILQSYYTCQLLRIKNQYLKYDGAKRRRPRALRARAGGGWCPPSHDRDFLHFQHVKVAFPCTV